MQKGPYFQPVQYISPIPEGYMQASANIGRSLGGALASIGETIGTSLEKYRKNKEEDQFLTGQAEAIVPSLQAYAGDIKDEKQKASYEGLIKRLGDFSGQSLSQKRATLAQAGTFVQSFKNARDAQISAMQLNAAKQEAANVDAYSKAMAGTPSTKSETYTGQDLGLVAGSQYLQDQGANASRYNPTLRQGNFSDIDTEALSGMMNRGVGSSQVPASLPPPSPITAAPISRGERVSNFVGGMINRASEYGKPVKSDSITAAPMTAAERAAAMSTSPIPADSITAAPMTAAERAAMSVSPNMAASAINFNKIPTSFNQQIAGLPFVDVERTRQVATNNKEKYQSAIATYLAEGGKLDPKMDQTLAARFNITPDSEIKVQQLKDDKGNVWGAAVISNGKPVHFVEAPKPTTGITADQERLMNFQDNMKSRTVDFNGSKFLVSQKEEANKIKDAIAANMDAQVILDNLMQLSESPNVKIPGTKEYARAKSLATQARGLMREQIVGPGAVNESEYAMLGEVISDPTAFFSVQENNRERLGSLKNTLNTKVGNKIKASGAQDMSGATVVGPSAPGSSVIRYSTTGQRI
jgi:hypothetical protein